MNVEKLITSAKGSHSVRRGEIASIILARSRLGRGQKLVEERDVPLLRGNELVLN
jgi:hypothetical protein